MPRSTISLPLIAALTLVTATAGADVYRHTDQRGNTTYTDKPETLPAERLNVQTHAPSAESQARAEAEKKRLAEADKSRQQSSTSSRNNAETTQLNAKDKADRCAKARERYDNYANSRRLYEQQENGERRYLSDEEMNAARASSKASMEELCK